MRKPEEDPLSGIVQRLVRALNPQRIYLFGSQARGDSSLDSDYDVLVIVAESDEPRYARAQSAYAALRGVGVPVDLLVLTREEFERDLPVVASLPATVAREGRILYAA